MRDIFFRHGRSDGDEPMDLGKVQADDALIEALRQTPLFDDGFARPGQADRYDDADTVSFTRADLVVGAAAFDTATPDDSDARIAAMLRAWQQEIDSVPMPAPIDLQVATAVIRSAPQRRRAVRPMIAVACAIAGLLVGSAAIGARSATPENVLWPVTQLLWGDRADSVLAAIDVREGIAEASRALVADNPDGAEVALDYVTSVITKVQPRDGRTGLESDLSNMQSQLESATSETTPATTDSATTDASATPSSSSTSATPTSTSPGSTTPPTTSSTPTTTTQPQPPPPPASSDDPTTPTTETSDTTTDTPTTGDTTPSTSDTTEPTTETTTSTSDTPSTTDTTTTSTSTDTGTSAQTTAENPVPSVDNPVPPADIVVPTA